MKRYSARYKTKNHSVIERFDDFCDAVNYLSKITSEKSYANNASIYDHFDGDKCVCAFRSLK